MSNMGVQLLVGLLLMVVALLLASASIGRSIRRDDKAITEGDLKLRKLRAARRARDANARRQVPEPIEEPKAAAIPAMATAARSTVVVERRAPDGSASAKAVPTAPVAFAAAVDQYRSRVERAPVASQATAVLEAEGRD